MLHLTRKEFFLPLKFDKKVLRKIRYKIIWKIFKKKEKGWKNYFKENFLEFSLIFLSANLVECTKEFIKIKF